MRSIASAVEIAASAERVWEVLERTSEYPAWNPFVRRLEGRLAVGDRIRVTLALEGRRPMTFRPTVLRAEAPRELRWIGRLGIPGLFDGEHVLRIEPVGPDRVRFHQEETFRGLLAGLILRSIGASTQRAFDSMNDALRARAERPP